MIKKNHYFLLSLVVVLLFVSVSCVSMFTKTVVIERYPTISERGWVDFFNITKDSIGYRWNVKQNIGGVVRVIGTSGGMDIGSDRMGLKFDETTGSKTYVLNLGSLNKKVTLEVKTNMITPVMVKTIQTSRSSQQINFIMNATVLNPIPAGKDKESINQMVGMLDDSNWMNRWYVLNTLKNSKAPLPKAALDKIKTMQKSDKRNIVRTEAYLVLKQYNME